MRIRQGIIGECGLQTPDDLPEIRKNEELIKKNAKEYI